MATESAPTIPDGPVYYDTMSYDTGSYDSYTTPSYDTGYTAPTPAPMPAPSSTRNGSINLNLYTSDYQVRGMGVRDELSKYGYSSISGSYTLPNRNLFGRGIHQRISGTYGFIWDASCVLGEKPMANLSYALGKEIFPNLIVEAGYTFRHGGLEGYMAHAHDGASHHATQELNLTITYNDNQKGFFGSAMWGLGFYGLTGSYFDLEIGYRFTDVISRGNIGSDLEISAGVAPSVGYWGSGIEGSDAYRLRAALRPYSHNGSFGRDSRFQLKPWIQCSWSGSNASKIDRYTGYSPVDHFQITVGVDMGLSF